MIVDAQQLIQQVRADLSAANYTEALARLRSAPRDQSGWTQQERDEVLCLEEFLNNLRNLRSPLCHEGRAE
jgi:hypothetical protein